MLSIKRICLQFFIWTWKICSGLKKWKIVNMYHWYCVCNFYFNWRKCGLQLWGNPKKSNILKIQTFQNIALRKIMNAPPYMSNHILHTDTTTKTINDETKIVYKRFHSKLNNHSNELIKNLSSPSIPGIPLDVWSVSGVVIF